MLANTAEKNPQSGSLSKDVHLEATSRYELINFIKSQLPLWRDRSDREAKTSETSLTSQLCAHLTSAARHSEWSFIQFRVEEEDEVQPGRKIDLVPAPCGATIWIDGRRHVDFDPILPIECKRLPIPRDKDRDEREYVINRQGSTGGIQRFKAGHHGAAHKVGAMIAYVQQETPRVWDKRVAEWIKDLIDSGRPGWTTGDYLHLETNDEAQGMAVFRSSHTRGTSRGPIELRHLWLNMN